MNKAGPNSKLKLTLPTQEDYSKFLTQSGTFKEGDLLVNKNGLRIVPQQDELVPPPIQPSDNQLTLADVDTIKVIGKGSGGIVQLVRHKWTGQFFALKIAQFRGNIGRFGDLTAQTAIGIMNPGYFMNPRFQYQEGIEFSANIRIGVNKVIERLSSNVNFAIEATREVIQMTIQETVRKQIVQELKINQSSSQCPYVVVCYNSFYDNGSIYIVLEYMDGGSLADFLGKVKSIPESYLSAICKQVLKGLIYLHHEKHIIHRDIKPSNLLVNHRGEVKITDFGVSAVLASSTGQRDTFVGTYNYMSPERISGSTYSRRSDIWSLGLVLLECATGRFPYSPTEEEGEWINFYELLEAIVNQPPPCAPSDQFSPEFCSFISACVQKDPKDRHSAQSLLNHNFITKYADQDVDLASYFTNVGSPLSTFST